jgi:hypothetical protein
MTVYISFLFPAFVLERFPHLSQSAFGAIVNSFTGAKANEIHQVEVSVNIYLTAILGQPWLCLY